MRPRTWTNDQLIRAVESSTTYVEVARKLGLVQATETINSAIDDLGIDDSHLSGRRWSDKELEKAVIHSNTLKEVAARLGLTQPNHSLRKRIKKLGLDTSHFTPNKRLTDKNLFKVYPKHTLSYNLRYRLHLIHQRAPEVLGADPSKNYRLRHKNGDPLDNRVENLTVEYL